MALMRNLTAEERLTILTTILQLKVLLGSATDDADAIAEKDSILRAMESRLALLKPINRERPN